jgi:hypothetical protein
MAAGGAELERGWSSHGCQRPREQSEEKKMEQRPSGAAVSGIARPGGNEPRGRREVGHGRRS